MDDFDDFSDSVCAICRAGGEMICCDGKCLRSFHPKCIGLREEDIPEDSPFVCSDCFSGIQRCFICSQFGIENELVKCKLPYCGKFYHPDCLGVSIDKDKFYCKLHTCDTCGDTNTDPAKRKQLWRCFRCPKAFDSKHRPRDVHVLAEGLFLCIRHTQEEEVWPEISQQLLDRLQNKLNRNTSSIHQAEDNQTSSFIYNNPQSTLPPTSNQSAMAPLNPRLSSTRVVQRDQSEANLERIKRLREERDRLDREADIRVSDLLPKKVAVASGSSYLGEDEPPPSHQFSPGLGSQFPPPRSLSSRSSSEEYPRHRPTVPCKFYIAGNCRYGKNCHFLHNIEKAPVPLSSIAPPPNMISHLQRHNEIRRKQQAMWKESWNRLRDIQDGHVSNISVSNRDEFPVEFQFSTPMQLSRTDAMLSRVFAPHPLSHHSSGSSTTQLLRTSSLLNQLDQGPYPSHSNGVFSSDPFDHARPDYQTNKRVRYGGGGAEEYPSHHRQGAPRVDAGWNSPPVIYVPPPLPVLYPSRGPYEEPPPPFFPTEQPPYPSHSQGRDHIYQEPPSAYQSLHSGRESDLYSHRPQIPSHVASPHLSRTEQLLAAAVPTHQPSTYMHPDASPSYPPHRYDPPGASRERLNGSNAHAKFAPPNRSNPSNNNGYKFHSARPFESDGRQSFHRSPPRHPLPPANAPPPLPAPVKKEEKMLATDLFAMLQATGLLPTGES